MLLHFPATNLGEPRHPSLTSNPAAVRRIENRSDRRTQLSSAESDSGESRGRENDATLLTKWFPWEHRVIFRKSAVIYVNME